MESGRIQAGAAANTSLRAVSRIPYFTNSKEMESNLMETERKRKNEAKHILTAESMSRIDRIIASAEERDACFSKPETVKADLEAAEKAWKNGYQGHTLEEVLAGMDRIIEEVGVEGT